MIQTINPPEAAHLEQDARYFLVQHMPDVIRKETRNVGVVVHKGDSLAAQFLGEVSPGSPIDRRKLKSLADPRVYRMWVVHWRKQMEKQGPVGAIQRFTEELSPSFKFIPGGEVADTGDDTADDVASYLFSMLVSDGGLNEAIGQQAEKEEVGPVFCDIRTEMRKQCETPQPAPSS